MECEYDDETGKVRVVLCYTVWLLPFGNYVVSEKSGVDLNKANKLWCSVVVVSFPIF